MYWRGLRTTRGTSMETTTAAEMPFRKARGTVRLLLRPEEGADAIGVSRARFYELMSAGRIKSIKIGRSRRIPLAELESWITRELAAQSD
jgi:excisionase family DNA binding protein